MKKQVKYLILYIALITGNFLSAQLPIDTDSLSKTTLLFQSEEALPMKMRYSQKDLRKITNDSTYMITVLSYQANDGSWKNLDVSMRERGYYRLENCYFAPVKIKIKKSMSRGTLFEGNKKLKLVLPCLLQKENNDKILKEFIAYKFFEAISPYHYKTRLVDIIFEEEKGKGYKEHQLRGFLIEDIDNVAERHGGNELKRSVHPLEQDDICSVKNDFFQYMIGNTDFSNAYRHNEKLLFIDKNTIPIPYDFDMSGLVDASYAVVSQIQNEKLSINDVTDRLYRGFKRSPAIYQIVRKEYLDHKDTFFGILDSFKPGFTDAEEFSRARVFLLEFFTVLEDDMAFGREILAQARVK